MEAALQSFSIRPVPALRPYIDRLWGWHGTHATAIALPTVLPGTGAELFFHYRAPFCRTTAEGSEAFAHAHLLCVRRTPVALHPAHELGFIAVRFRAGMLPRFVDVPMRELMDRTPAVDDLWGPAGRDAAQRVAESDRLDDRLHVIQSFLLTRLRPHAPDPPVEMAMAAMYRGMLPVAELAACTGLGKRQLERRFKAVTGQTLTEVRRIARFQKTVRALLLDPSRRYLDAALAHGYYDQAHFIRDFHAFAGASPQRHLAAARAKSHFYNTPWPASGNMDLPTH